MIETRKEKLDRLAKSIREALSKVTDDKGRLVWSDGRPIDLQRLKREFDRRGRQ